jgi:hypothetical protein
MGEISSDEKKPKKYKIYYFSGEITLYLCKNGLVRRSKSTLLGTNQIAWRRESTLLRKNINRA